MSKQTRPRYDADFRSKAFAELLNHDLLEVKEIAKAKLSILNKSIRKNRERESNEYNQREQRFE